MKRKIIATLVAGVLIGCCSQAYAGEPTIFYDDQKLTLQEPSIIQDGRTLVSVRDIGTQMGLNVSWDNGTRIATLEQDGRILQFQPDLKRVLLNSLEQPIDVGPQIINNRVYLPLRYLFELTGADVSFETASNGQQTVTVTSAEKKHSYVHIQGRETIVERTSSYPIDNHPVVILHSGAVCEVSLQDDYMDIVKIAPPKYIGNAIQEDRALYREIDTVMKIDNKYYAVLDAAQNPKYVGTGYHPMGIPLLNEIHTPQGDYRFYGSVTDVDTFDLEGAEGFSVKTIRGNLLSTDENIKDSDYAFPGNDCYGFLTDGQFLLIGKNNTKGYHVVSCKQVSNSLCDGKVFFSEKDNLFHIIGIDKDANGNSEVYITAFSETGMQATGYRSISDFGANYHPLSLAIRDAVQIDETVYLLLKTDSDTFLGKYDMESKTLSCEKLGDPYNQFVLAQDSYQLYYGEKNAYHFYALN